MKVLVVEAEAQGATRASILSKDGDTSAIVLADMDLGLATKVKDKRKSDKIRLSELTPEKPNSTRALGLGATSSMNLNQGIRQ